jgi:hypothetical protein
LSLLIAVVALIIAASAFTRPRRCAGGHHARTDGSPGAISPSFGVVFLGPGILFNSQRARLASAVVIALTILKVFLVDMSTLTGFYRALPVPWGWCWWRLAGCTSGSRFADSRNRRAAGRVDSTRAIRL